MGTYGVVNDPIKVNAAFDARSAIGAIKLLCTIRYKVKFAIQTGFTVHEADWK